MPIYFRCPHCGKRIARGEKCGCNFKRDRREPEGIKRLYHTSRWTRLQRTIMARYNGLDQYALTRHQRIEYADTVHHIVPANEDPARFWDPDNLIPLSRHSHDEVHVTYRDGAEAKSDCQRFLQSLVKSISESI